MDRIAAGRTNPWLVFLLPLVVYMLVGSFEPAAPPMADRPAADAAPPSDLGIPYRAYPLIYTVKLVLALIAVAFVWPGYRQFPWRGGRSAASGAGAEMRRDEKGEPQRTSLGSGPIDQQAGLLLAIAVGIVGAAAWIGLAVLQRELIAGRWGWDFGLGKRSAFDPLVQLADRPAWAYTFLAIRFLGLVVLVPVIEEFFLRGFLMRFAVAADWWAVPFGVVNRLAVFLGTAVPALMHPQEALAAAVWFSAVTWLMLRTRSLWDCVAAHAVTNLSLGVYVLASGMWWLM